MLSHCVATIDGVQCGGLMTDEPQQNNSLYVAEAKSPLILAVTQEARESLASSSGKTTPRRYSTFLGIEPTSRDVRGKEDPMRFSRGL